MGNRGRRGAESPGRHPAARPGPTDADGARPLPGRAERRRLAQKVKRKRRRSAVKEIPLLIAVALMIALVLKTFLVQAFVIPSGSMEQTIRIGDRVLVDKLTPWFGSKPQRGDVVVFKDPGGWLQDERAAQEGRPDRRQAGQGGPDLHRTAALGRRAGPDQAGGRGRRGHRQVLRQATGGSPSTAYRSIEPYLNPGNVPSTLKFEVTVPAGRMFVMGDHRSNSADSRFHLDEKDQRHGLRGRGRRPGRRHRLAVRPLAEAGGAGDLRIRARRARPGRPRRSARRIGCHLRIRTE